MTTPPLPPRPYGAYQQQQHGRQPSLPPPIPPLPAQYRPPAGDYHNSDQPLTPHLTEPLVAPRPQKILSDVPANMARRLDDQLSSPPPPPQFPRPNPSYFQPPPPPPNPGPYNPQPGFAQSPRSPQPGWTNNSRLPPRSPQPGAFPTPPLEQTQSFGAAGTYGLGIQMSNMSLNDSRNQPRPTSQYTLPPLEAEQRQSPPRKNAQGLPELTAAFPTVQSLLDNQNQSELQYQVRWCKDVFWLVDKSQQVGGTGPPLGPAHLSDPQLQLLAEQAANLILRIAPPLPAQNLPIFIAEALYLKGKLLTSGAFPEQCPSNPREAFRCFEASARAGYAPAWFQLGRDYESVNDNHRARDCFDRGVRAKVESCYYRMGMANLLGQLNIPVDLTKAIPLLRNAAFSASIDVPQPAYVYGLLLLGEFPDVTIPPHLFSPYLPQGSTLQTEARRHIERAAYLGFSPAQYKMGHAYEFATPPFPFDPLLSVQYYSLASQQGEDEADMALSKWFLCGAEGAFEKDEALAFTFAEKAVKKGLATAQFALGYYAEVGVGRPKNLDDAREWYEKAAAQGNADAQERINALAQPTPQMLSRQEHDTLTDVKLVRKHTQAKNSAAAAGHVQRRSDVQESQQIVGTVRKNSVLHRPNRRGPTVNVNQTVPSNPEPSPTQRHQVRPAGAMPPHSADHRRYQTGPGPATPRPPMRREQSESLPQQRPPQGRPQLVSSPPPIEPDNSIPGGPFQTLPTRGPATFQEMGIATGKLEEKDCVIM